MARGTCGHRGIRYLSLEQRHLGADHAILASRHALYTAARECNPAPWFGKTRNWSPIGTVTLNPELDSVVRIHTTPSDKLPLAALTRRQLP